MAWGSSHDGELDRYLLHCGQENMVIDAASIKVERRAKRTKVAQQLTFGQSLVKQHPLVSGILTAR